MGLSIFHKIHVGESRPLLRKCLTKIDWEKTHYLRSKGGYMPYPNYGNKFQNSFFPYIAKNWNNLPPSLKSLNLLEFKIELKKYLKPDTIRYFKIGQKESNSIFTRFRTGRTILNASRYSIGQTEDPSCLCHHKSETSEHFFLDCFLYSTERQTLFNLAEHLIPRFMQLNRKEKYDILTEGINKLDPEFYYTNIKISLAVQKFILQTKRFSYI